MGNSCVSPTTEVKTVRPLRTFFGVPSPVKFRSRIINRFRRLAQISEVQRNASWSSEICDYLCHCGPFIRHVLWVAARCRTVLVLEVHQLEFVRLTRSNPSGSIRRLWRSADRLEAPPNILRVAFEVPHVRRIRYAACVESLVKSSDICPSSDSLTNPF